MIDAKETTMINQREAGRVKSLKGFLYWLILVLMLTSAQAWGQSGGTVTYVYTDPQGTPLAEADASGNITATFEYTPYGTYAPGGTSKPGPTPNGPGYTGHVNDAETNLVYMQARYYDSVTGHFLSVDPVQPVSGEEFKFNRYAYTNNNPIGMTDPNGKDPLNLTAIKGAIITFAVNLAWDVGSGVAHDMAREIRQDWKNNTYTVSYGAGGTVATEAPGSKSVAVTSSATVSLNNHGQVAVNGSIGIMGGYGSGSSFGQQVGLSRSEGLTSPGLSYNTTLHVEGDYAVPGAPGFSMAVDVNKDSFASAGASERVSEGEILFAGVGTQYNVSWTSNSLTNQQNSQPENQPKEQAQNQAQSN